MTWLLLLALTVWAIGRFYLRGEDLIAYDEPRLAPRSSGPDLNDEHRAVHASLTSSGDAMNRLSRKERLKFIRDYMDGMSDGLPVSMMLIGKHFDEPTIYRAAHAFEQAGDWKAM